MRRLAGLEDRVSEQGTGTHPAYDLGRDLGDTHSADFGKGRINQGDLRRTAEEQADEEIQHGSIKPADRKKFIAGYIDGVNVAHGEKTVAVTERTAHSVARDTHGLTHDRSYKIPVRGSTEPWKVGDEVNARTDAGWENGTVAKIEPGEGGILVKFPDGESDWFYAEDLYPPGKFKHEDRLSERSATKKDVSKEGYDLGWGAFEPSELGDEVLDDILGGRAGAVANDLLDNAEREGQGIYAEEVPEEDIKAWEQGFEQGFLDHADEWVRKNT